MNWKLRGLYSIPFPTVNLSCNHQQAFTLLGLQVPRRNHQSLYKAPTLCGSLDFACIISFHPHNNPLALYCFYLHFADENTEA